MLKRQILLCVLLTFMNCLSLFAGNRQQLEELMLREIGNDFLLELGDSTSRILPIEFKNQTYVVKFDRHFSFNPEVLVNITRNGINRFDVGNKWLIEVKTCDSLNVVHSFQLSTSKKVEQISCLLRSLPLDCYFFTFSNLKENLEPIQLQTGLSSDKPSPKKSPNTFWSAIIIIALIFGLLYFVKIIRSKKHIDFKKIGKFRFDENKMTLTLDRQIIELSGKESELLSLLYRNKNKTLERDVILNEVWGDEGDYVGRTLDVFISKLRKKLAFDKEIEIINIRGIGYRLVIP